MDVWLPVATLLVGFFAGIAGDLLRDRRQAALAREAVKEARHDRYLEMKQAALLELSEIVEDVNLSRGTVQRFERRRDVQEDPAEWAKVQEQVDEAYIAGLVPVTRMRAVLARIGDDELTALVGAFGSAITAEPFDHAEMVSRLGPVQARIGSILATLAEAD